MAGESTMISEGLERAAQLVSQHLSSDMLERMASAVGMADKLGLNLPGGPGVEMITDKLSPAIDLMDSGDPAGALDQMDLGPAGDLVSSLASGQAEVGDSGGPGGMDLSQLASGLVEQLPMSEQLEQLTSGLPTGPVGPEGLDGP